MPSQVEGFIQNSLFSIGETSVTVKKIILTIVCLILTWWVSKITQKMIRRAFEFRGIVDERRVGVFCRLVHYILLFVGVGISFRILGIDVSTLFTAGAIFAVGIGIAMQSITQNFVSGVILLVERSIKPGDILEVDGRVVKVVSMGIRSTIMQTHDAEDIIMPNSDLIQSPVKNFTLDDTAFRLRAEVGVAYESDMSEVKRTLLGIAKRENEKWGEKRRNCWVAIKSFGDSTVNFDVGIWVRDPWKQTIAKAELYEGIWWGLKKANITIAFPQLDVHLNHVDSDSKNKKKTKEET